MDMQVKAVIDRFEGNKAVLLIGEEEKQGIWPKAFLPKGVQEGQILQIKIVIDEEATREAQNTAAKLLAQLTGQSE